MTLIWLLLSLCAAGAALSELTVRRRASWLERAVNYYRRHYFNYERDHAPVLLRASLAPAPAGYVDSELWEFTSVARLLELLGASEAAAPVRLALRRALRPSHSTRRFISKQQSWNLFPSLGKEHDNEIYYDFESGENRDDEEMNPGAGMVQDNAVVVLQNPVEARLPSARISVKLLRQILEARALSARQMPSTSPPTFAWVTKNGTNDTSKAANKTKLSKILPKAHFGGSHDHYAEYSDTASNEAGGHAHGDTGDGAAAGHVAGPGARNKTKVKPDYAENSRT